MRPFCRSNCGGCHLSSTYLGPTSAADIFSGAPVGTVYRVEKKMNKQLVFPLLLLVVYLFLVW